MITLFHRSVFGSPRAILPPTSSFRVFRDFRGQFRLNCSRQTKSPAARFRHRPARVGANATNGPPGEADYTRRQNCLRPYQTSVENFDAKYSSPVPWPTHHRRLRRPSVACICAQQGEVATVDDSDSWPSGPAHGNAMLRPSASASVFAGLLSPSPLSQQKRPPPSECNIWTTIHVKIELILPNLLPRRSWQVLVMASMQLRSVSTLRSTALTGC